MAYSLVGLQEMNLAYRFPVIYWNCACLITDAGGAEIDEEGTKNNNYGKIATAIGKMMSAGINVSLPDINTSEYTFYPDEKSNRIIYGMRGMVAVGDELISAIIANRPYSTVKDFYNRIHPNKTSMISLIKGGMFDNLMDRKEAMCWYLWIMSEPKKKLNLQNMSTLLSKGYIPKDTDEQRMALRVYEFNRYLKAMCHTKGSTVYKLDVRAIDFLIELGLDNLIINGMLNEKMWKKQYDKWMDIFRQWLADNQQSVLDKLNFSQFKEEWDKYASGSISRWEMDSLCFYYHEHELANVNKFKYGISNFNDLAEEPVVEYTKKIRGKQINLFKLEKICGTCIDKNKSKGTVTLLTTSGVVNVKFNRGQFLIFDKQISAINDEGEKKVIDKSWFNRGSMLMVTGFRKDDDFIAKTYASTAGHTLYKIVEIKDNGDLQLLSERKQGEANDAEDD